MSCILWKKIKDVFLFQCTTLKINSDPGYTSNRMRQTHIHTQTRGTRAFLPHLLWQLATQTRMGRLPEWPSSGQLPEKVGKGSQGSCPKWPIQQGHGSYWLGQLAGDGVGGGEDSCGESICAHFYSRIRFILKPWIDLQNKSGWHSVHSLSRNV